MNKQELIDYINDLIEKDGGKVVITDVNSTVKHKLGNIYNITSDRPTFSNLEGEYILAQVKFNIICLISLTNGNRLLDPVKIKDVLDITEEDFLKTINDEDLSYSLVVGNDD